MNAKGIKFLAVLAVLAMAFAAFAVMTDTEQNSAAIPEEVTAVSTEADFETAITGNKEFNVKLDDDIVIDTAGATGFLVKSAGVIDFNGHTLTVKTALSPVTLDPAIELPGNDDGKSSILVNKSSGLILKDSSADGKGGIINAAAKVGTSANKIAVLFNLPGGVATIDSGSYVVDNGDIAFGEVDANKSYWYTIKNLGKLTINGGYIAGMNHYWDTPVAGGNAKLSSVIVNGWTSANKAQMISTATLVVNGGTFEYGAYLKNDEHSDATINGGTVKNALSGALTNYGKLTMNGGEFSSIQNLNWLANESYGDMTITDDIVLNGKFTNNGKVTLDSSTVRVVGGLSYQTDATKYGGPGTFEIKNSAKLILDEGTTIASGFNFQYTDEYGDVHGFSFTGDATITVGMGGLEIYAGESMICLDGTIALADGESVEMECSGNVVVSGIIYTDYQKTESSTTTTKSVGLTISKIDGDEADVKLAGLQVVGSGKVTLDASVLVLADTSFYVKGKLTVNSILKVAEGAVVKSEGEFSMGNSTADAPCAIWNAGQVVIPADSYTTGKIDNQLVRVYMNSTEGTGKFFAGSAEYDGTGTTAPLAVAYGAYIDITGKCSVNLTSNNITVVNTLYKYYTMILATKNTTIPLTVDYPNQYPATIDLKGKDFSTAERTAKSATFRNVVWETPDVATIFITAPEEYAVKLVDGVTYDTTGKEVTAIGSPVTTGITFTDQNNRVIVPDTNGIVKLVFGYEYDIKGAHSTSKYKFIDVFKAFDLTEKSKTEAYFTMIRDPTITYGVVDQNNTEKTTENNGLLAITEGYAAKITVTVDPASKMTGGQVFLYYKVDKTGQEIPVAYIPGDNATVITGIYTNDEIYFKAVDIDFYKYEFGTIAKHEDTTPAKSGWQDVPALSTTDAKTIPTDGWTAVAGVVGNDGKIGTDGKGGVILPINIVDDSITLSAKVSGDVPVGKTQSFTISWVNVQKTPVTVTSSTGTAGDPVEVPLLADEIITITWDDINNVRQTMKILGKEYNKGTEYTVSTKVAATTEKTMVLELDKIEYAKVKNSSTKDFTVTDGNFTNVVAKTKTVDKAVEAFNESMTATDIKPTLVTLVIEGQSVVSWTYTLWDAQATPVKVENYIEKNVVGETAAIPLVDGYTIEVTALNTIYNQYIVKTQPVDHVQIGDYSRVGHMNDNMFVYYSVDDKYTLKGVEVYYEDPENEGFPDLERGVYANAEPKTAADGQKYWAYKMPASNVYLKPIVDSDYAIITYKNYDGTVLQTGEVKKGTMPEYTGATPVKPATATETYRFAGWEPAVVAVTADATYTATFETVAPTSTDVTIFLEKAQNGVKVTLLANDGRFLQDGSVEFTYYYAYELNGKWATGFKTCTAQTGEINEKLLFQFTVDLSEQERFAETMWIEGTYTSADEAVNAASELIVYQ